MKGKVEPRKECRVVELLYLVAEIDIRKMGKQMTECGGRSPILSSSIEVGVIDGKSG